MPREKIVRRNASVPVALMVIFLCGCGAPAEGLVLSLGHVGASGSLYDVVTHEFARRIEEGSGGSVRIEVFGASAKGDDEIMLQRLRQGSLDLALPSSVLSSAVEAFGLFDLPYLVAGRDDMVRLGRTVIWPELAPAAQVAGLEVLAVWENGTRHITTRDRPIKTPEDLVGLRIRTPRSVWRVKLFQQWGATASSLPFQNVLEALRSASIDGQENPIVQIRTAGLADEQGHLSLTGHLYSPAFLTMGRARWARLDPSRQALLLRVARELEPFARETGARMETEMLADLQAAGMTVTEPDRDAFRRSAQPIYEEFARTTVDGARLLALANSARVN